MKKLIPFLIIILCTSVAHAQSGTKFNPFTNNMDYCLWVEEQDGDPSLPTCPKLKFTNGSLTDNGDGTVSVSVTGTFSGGSAGGSDTQVQFNDSTAFGGDSDFTWNKTTNVLTLGGSSKFITSTGTMDVGSATEYCEWDFTGANVWKITCDDTGVATIDLNTGSVDLTVNNEAYGVGWNGSNEVPTKNAVYDQMETVSGGADNVLIDGADTVNPDFTSDGDIDFSISGTIVTADINAGTIGSSDFSNDDFGDWSFSGGNAEIDEDTIGATELNDNDVPGDEECLTYESATTDFEWQTCGTGGGGGSVAGSDTHVQYNLSGTFGGEAAFTYDYTLDKVTVLGTIVSNGMDVNGSSESISFDSGGVIQGSGGSIYINPSGGTVRLPDLLNCDTIDTDANGDMSCGTDDGGSGDVTDVGDCASGACGDGTSDGGSYLRLYDGDSHYAQIDVVDLNANRTINLPNVDGDICTSGAICTNYEADFGADGITHTDIADSDQADTKCIWFEDPTASDDFNSIWANKTANDFLITEIWAESDQTVNFDLQIDDGTPADVNGTDISPAAGEAEDTTLSGDITLAAGEELDLAITSVANTPTWVSICFTGNWVD